MEKHGPKRVKNELVGPVFPKFGSVHVALFVRVDASKEDEKPWVITAGCFRHVECTGHHVVDGDRERANYGQKMATPLPLFQCTESILSVR